VAYKSDKADRRLQVQNSVNATYIISMTHLESLMMQLQYVVQKYGENEPVAQELRQQIEELRQHSPASRSKTQDEGESGMLSFHMGFRKAKPTGD
jgi:hypothetical protein